MKLILLFIFICLSSFAQSWEGCEVGSICHAPKECRIISIPVKRDSNEITKWKNTCEKFPLAIYDKKTHQLEVYEDDEISKVKHFASPTSKLRLLDDKLTDSLLIKVLEHGLGYCRLNQDFSSKSWREFELLFDEVPFAGVYVNSKKHEVAHFFEFGSYGDVSISPSSMRHPQKYNGRKKRIEAENSLKNSFLNKMRAKVLSGECYVKVNNDYLTLDVYEGDLLSTKDLQMLIQAGNEEQKKSGFINKAFELYNDYGKYLSPLMSILAI